MALPNFKILSWWVMNMRSKIKFFGTNKENCYFAGIWSQIEDVTVRPVIMLKNATNLHSLFQNLAER